eukprot:TRINITY_DN59046_c0_g1_i1.p2 TRINITY_DN59046_c0_g1~~TRINITY_DN59046_c0_g1_i1.p2  ORF type:complete len:112 (+),score=6.66 TRINITY_DN59046_c0_g1_i1:227-562(+)
MKAWYAMASWLTLRVMNIFFVAGVTIHATGVRRAVVPRSSLAVSPASSTPLLAPVRSPQLLRGSYSSAGRVPRQRGSGRRSKHQGWKDAQHGFSSRLGSCKTGTYTTLSET